MSLPARECSKCGRDYYSRICPCQIVKRSKEDSQVQSLADCLENFANASGVNIDAAIGSLAYMLKGLSDETWTMVDIELIKRGLK
jgi:hypothetical protein